MPVYLMSAKKRTCKVPKGWGFEYWMPRPGKGAYSPGGNTYGKRLTHKAERREGRTQARQAA
jgi:hypothetical protein